MARWEIQQRQRQNLVGNLGADNLQESPGQKYKRAFFVDWRAADHLKKSLLEKIDFWLDTNRDIPKLVTGSAMRDGLKQLARRPFRVVPYFDRGPWGGHWMEEVCGLPPGTPNYAWCFDCVPEENRLLLCFRRSMRRNSSHEILPCFILVSYWVTRYFLDSGAEFPRFVSISLDTMGGGNLSLQVHPRTQFIREHFGMQYTQDESYYMLDAGDDGSVYLGLKTSYRSKRWHDSGAEGSSRRLRVVQPLRLTSTTSRPGKHDHFLIPAGTIHCSGSIAAWFLR